MRPDIRIIQNQEETTNTNDINSFEAEQLLRKYGFGETSFSSIENSVQTNNDLSFEEMIAKHEREKQAEINKINNPKPITFNGDNGYNSEIKYASDSDISFKIEISSDMKIPKY